VKRKIKTLIHLLKLAGVDEAAEVETLSNKQDLELHIFDFDGTLFRSPEKPAGWKGSWWANKLSLEPPCVPDKPGDEWWISKTVSAAMAAISDPNIFAVCLTGRQDFIYRGRLPIILNEKGLNFDMIRLSDGQDTGRFKSSHIRRLLNQHRSIKKVVIWEDNAELLETYIGVIISVSPDIEIETHLVNEGSMPVGEGCSPEVKNKDGAERRSR
jgi:hypothetical protein